MTHTDAPDDIEEGTSFRPKFDSNGLLTAVVIDATNQSILMLAHMNAEALALSISTGDAWYYSRSRRKLWRKGETSGHTQKIVEILIDCDQDAVILRVEQRGPAGHTSRRSCFYRRIVADSAGNTRLEFVKTEA